MKIKLAKFIIFCNVTCLRFFLPVVLSSWLRLVKWFQHQLFEFEHVHVGIFVLLACDCECTFLHFFFKYLPSTFWGFNHWNDPLNGLFYSRWTTGRWELCGMNLKRGARLYQADQRGSIDYLPDFFSLILPLDFVLLIQTTCPIIFVTLGTYMPPLHPLWPCPWWHWHLRLMSKSWLQVWPRFIPGHKLPWPCTCEQHFFHLVT